MSNATKNFDIRHNST